MSIKNVIKLDRAINLRERDRSCLEQSVHDQHGSEVDHDVGLEVLDTDEVCPVGDHEQREGGEVDTDDVVGKPPLQDHVEVSLAAPRLVLHLDHLQ